MEERKTRRHLRNNANCVPMQNIFKNNQYIRNSASQCIPPQILTKLKQFQTISCEDINSLTFINNQSHSNALNRMKQGFEFQKGTISKHQPGVERAQEVRMFPYNVNSGSGGITNDEKQPQMIKSEQQQNQYRLQFHQKYEGGATYQKQNQFNHYGEEILYNQFFRNDLENLFLQ